MSAHQSEYEVIVVGSGTCGATIAKDLSAAGKKVLLLEKGAHKPLKETFLGFVSVANMVKLGDKLGTARAITTGGSSAMYFAVCEKPDLSVFDRLGMDLSSHLSSVESEVPLTEVPDELLGEQVIRLRDAAESLGHDWYKRQMFVDMNKVNGGYSYDAKWKARSFVEQAQSQGCSLINRAEVIKVLTDNGKAIGVEYKLYSSKKDFEVKTAYADKVVLAAGACESPLILKRSGVDDVVSKGFYLHPSTVVVGFVPGMKGVDTFGGSLGTPYVDNLGYGDANMNRLLYRLFMIGNGKWRKVFSHSKAMGIGIIARDKLSGGLVDGERYHKEIDPSDLKKLDKGEGVAREILQKAGAKDIFRSNVSPSHAGGMLHIGEDVDSQFQSRIAGCYVCDGSVVPDAIRIAPTMTLLCMSKYLAAQLLAG